MRSVNLDTSEPGVVIVVLEGEHELFTATKLQRRLEALIDEGLALVVDLTRATFLDSSIVSVLLRARERARDAGTSYAIVLDESSAYPVRRMFEITGLDRYLPVVPTRTKALPHTLAR
jgi:anti-sigma B factor antagonist